MAKLTTQELATYVARAAELHAVHVQYVSDQAPRRRREQRIERQHEERRRTKCYAADRQRDAVGDAHFDQHAGTIFG
jgi:hypothetical protein